MKARKMAFDFAEWLINMGYNNKDDVENDIDEMIKDFETMEKMCPKMFNLLRLMTDRA